MLKMKFMVWMILVMLIAEAEALAEDDPCIRLADQLRLTAESLAAFLSSLDRFPLLLFFSTSAILFSQRNFKTRSLHFFCCLRLAARAEGGRGLGGKECGEALARFAASQRTAPAFLGRISE